MDTNGYAAGTAKGAVPIEKFVEQKYLDEAKSYEQLFQSLTLSGKITRTNRTPEQKQIDKDAIDLLLEMQEASNPAIAYGFMLYNEEGIVKQYWHYRVGKLRKNKKDFFNLDKYLEWLTEIFSALNGDHPSFHDPLYYFKPGGKSRKGDTVGDYDVMNSFRFSWNSYFLSNLAIYLWRQDEKYNDYGVSIEAAMENENGAGNHLEAEIAANANVIHDPEADATFDSVENFLKAFTESPLSDPIPFKAGTTATGISYRDVIRAIVDGTMKNPTNVRARFNFGLSIQNRIMSKIKSLMDDFGITTQDLADYISAYRTVALDILDGQDASFRKVDA